jgi:predicted nucleotidyltransferase
MEKEEILRKIAEVLKKEKKVAFAYLFGSFLLNKYSNDIDLAVYVKGKVDVNFESRLALKLEKEIGKEFDVFVINDKPTLFLSEVFRRGKLVFSRDENLRVKFETEKLPEVLEYNELIKQFDEKRFEKYGIG